MRVFTVEVSEVEGWNDTPEQKEEKNEKVRALLESVGVSTEGYKKINYEKFVVTEVQFVDMCMKGVKCHIMTTTNIGDEHQAIETLSRLLSKVEAFADTIGNCQFNEKVEVYTPGMGLMLFNRVMLLQDGCSDELQGALDDGWKIVAACPQPDQRRPDYIMGRYDPTYHSGANNAALREHK